MSAYLLTTVLAVLVALLVWRWLRAERGWSFAEKAHRVSIGSHASAVNQLVAEQKTVRQLRAVEAALTAQNGRLTRRLNIAEAELDTLRTGRP